MKAFPSGIMGVPHGTVVKNSPANAGDERAVSSIQCEFDSWRRKWQLAPVFMPGESHGQRSLGGYSPWVAQSQT